MKKKEDVGKNLLEGVKTLCKDPLCLHTYAAMRLCPVVVLPVSPECLCMCGCLPAVFPRICFCLPLSSSASALCGRVEHVTGNNPFSRDFCATLWSDVFWQDFSPDVHQLYSVQLATGGL